MEQRKDQRFSNMGFPNGTSETKGIDYIKSMGANQEGGNLHFRSQIALPARG